MADHTSDHWTIMDANFQKDFATVAAISQRLQEFPHLECDFQEANRAISMLFERSWVTMKLGIR